MPQKGLHAAGGTSKPPATQPAYNRVVIKVKSKKLHTRRNYLKANQCTIVRRCSKVKKYKLLYYINNFLK